MELNNMMGLSWQLLWRLYVMGQQREQLPTTPVKEQLQADMEGTQDQVQ